MILKTGFENLNRASILNQTDPFDRGQPFDPAPCCCGSIHIQLIDAADF